VVRPCCAAAVLLQCWCAVRLWGLHLEKQGGILGDDMGLGKTVQICAFLSGLFQSRLAKRVLLLAPVSVLEHWQAELAKWCQYVRLRCFHGQSKKQRAEALNAIQSKGGVLLTTYGMLQSNVEQLAEWEGEKAKWDYMILDEGHRIKNPDIKLSQAVRAVPASHRVLLTGTPIQNNLLEVWSLFDFVCQGRVLGDRKTFKREFADKIIAGTDRKATERERQLGAKLAEQLRSIIAPYFLRREKKDVFPAEGEKKEQRQQQQQQPQRKEQQDEEEVSGEEEERSEEAKEEKGRDNSASLPKQLRLTVQKNDLILWLYLSETQLQVYRAFLETAQVKEALNSSRSPLAALTVLKKICDHPRLLSEEMKMCAPLQLSWGNRDDSPATLISESGKLRMLVQLLGKHREEGHRTLVFSQSKRMLDIIERVLEWKNMKRLRIDGDVVKPAERQRRIDLFNSDPSYMCFLLTTQTGGLGISLTTADRVIIFDPAWNPAVDDQAAMLRCCRTVQWIAPTGWGRPAMWWCTGSSLAAQSRRSYTGSKSSRVCCSRLR